MLVYKAAFFVHDDGVHVEALDFPGVVSCGRDLDEARRMIRSALLDLAEFYVSRGKRLPRPDPASSIDGAEQEEPLCLRGYDDQVER